jgi:hypothetical protein
MNGHTRGGNLNECLELKIWIKVAKDRAAKNMPDATAVNELMVKVQKIWGCPGQCCITVRLDTGASNPTMDAAIPTTIDRNDKKPEDFWQDTDWPANSGDKCIKVILIDDLIGAGERGVTTHGNRVVVPMRDDKNDRTIDDIAETLAHELGHVMGLAPDDAEDENGITGHSKKDNNLMGKSKDRYKLNKLQCDKARESKYLLPIANSSCQQAPLEK